MRNETSRDVTCDCTLAEEGRRGMASWFDEALIRLDPKEGGDAE